jgi:hypothetical protein
MLIFPGGEMNFEANCTVSGFREEDGAADGNARY